MIIGSPEKFRMISPEGLPSPTVIPITEECKLLPATGISAVSVKNDNLVAKGMILICQEKGKLPFPLLHIFNNEDQFLGKKTTILFHKMIHGTVSLSNPAISRRMELAKAEISGLI